MSARSRAAAQPGQLVRQPADAVGYLQEGDPLGGGREQDTAAVAGGGDVQGDGQVHLAGTRWSEHWCAVNDCVSISPAPVGR
jgi:hypothetical protein